MGICPNCGEWVDEGDICMCCGGGGGYENDDDDYGKYRPRRSSGYTPMSRQESEIRQLKSKKRMYESSLNSARSEENFTYKMRHYNDAADYFNSYGKLSKRSGREIEGMPDAKHMLSFEDIKWLSRRHEESMRKFSLFGNDERDELEKFLKKSGNEDIVQNNISRRNAELEANSRKYRIERAQKLREHYFELIDKANGLVDENNLKKAMKEYRNAYNCWNNYYHYDYKNDPKKDEMPENKFTCEAVEHMMAIYVETHPILTSKKKQLKVNAEIVKMLDGKWDDKIHEGDVKAQEIHDEKQRRKKEAVKKVGAAIGDAMIFADRMIKGFRK